MWISYSDSEVNRFHPICERALNYALRLIGKDDQYRVLHHQYTGALEMDYVVQNIATGKYLLFLGDSDGFSILYYQDVDSLIYWANQAAYRWKLRGMCMWSLGQEDMRVWEWLPKQTE